MSSKKSKSSSKEANNNELYILNTNCTIEGAASRLRFTNQHSLNNVQKLLNKAGDFNIIDELYKNAIGSIKDADRISLIKSSDDKITICIKYAKFLRKLTATNLDYNARNCDSLAELISAINPIYKDFLIARDLKNRIDLAYLVGHGFEKSTSSKYQSTLTFNRDFKKSKSKNIPDERSVYEVSYGTDPFNAKFDRCEKRLMASIFIDPGMSDSPNCGRDILNDASIRPDSPLNTSPSYAHWRWFANSREVSTIYGQQFAEDPNLLLNPEIKLSHLENVANYIKERLGEDLKTDGDFYSIYDSILSKISDPSKPIIGAIESISCEAAQIFFFLNSVKEVEKEMRIALEKIDIKVKDLRSNKKKREEIENACEDNSSLSKISIALKLFDSQNSETNTKQPPSKIFVKCNSFVKAINLSSLPLCEVSKAMDFYLQKKLGYIAEKAESLDLESDLERITKNPRFNYSAIKDIIEINHKASKSAGSAKKIPGANKAARYYVESSKSRTHIIMPSYNFILENFSKFEVNYPQWLKSQKTKSDLSRDGAPVDFEELLSNVRSSLELHKNNQERIFSGFAIFARQFRLFSNMQKDSQTNKDGTLKDLSRSIFNKLFKDSFGKNNDV